MVYICYRTGCAWRYDPGYEGKTDHRESREYQAGGGDAMEDEGVVARDCGGGGVVCDIVGV